LCPPTPPASSLFPYTTLFRSNCSEPGPLSSVCLFLDKPYPENLLLNVRQERVHDLRLFDSQSLGEDLFHGYDLSLLDLSAELGFRNPSDLLTGALAHLATSKVAVDMVFLISSAFSVRF